jgi:hypothetical protein
MENELSYSNLINYLVRDDGPKPDEELHSNGDIFRIQFDKIEQHETEPNLESQVEVLQQQYNFFTNFWIPTLLD